MDIKCLVIWYIVYSYNNIIVFIKNIKNLYKIIEMDFIFVKFCL